MGGGGSKASPKLSNLLVSTSKEDRDTFDRAFAKYPPTPSRTWGFQARNEAIYANDSWLSTQKRIRMSDINRFMGLRPYVGKPAGGKVHNLNEIAMVWGNPQYLDEETQNYNLSFARQQHHDMGCTPCCIAMMSTSRDFRRSPQVQRHEWRQFL